MMQVRFVVLSNELMCPYTGSHQAESEETAHQTAEGCPEKTSAEG